MFSIFGIGFTAPILLLALLVLPIIWIILRAVPPAPIRRAFPGVALLLGLDDKEAQTDKTPWWLLLLRALVIATLIVGFAGPVLNPVETTDEEGPLLIIADASWASAATWAARQKRIAGELAAASRLGRPAALVRLSDPPPADAPLAFTPANDLIPGLAGFEPTPWEPGAEAVEWAAKLSGRFDTLWLSDGLERTGRDEIYQSLEGLGDVTIVETPVGVTAISPPEFVDGAVALSVMRTTSGDARSVTVNAIGPDPAGISRVLANTVAEFASNEKSVTIRIEAPPELRNRFQRFELAGIQSAGAVALADDSLRKREVALFTGSDSREGLRLLSPEHYLRQALAPSADIIDGALTDILTANPDVIILADVAKLAGGESDALQVWVENGGLLVRFAGPKLAASEIARAEEDPLLPVRLRVGGRSIGGAMSWGDPRRLRAFGSGTPFAGLAIPDDVRVNAQVLAQPDPNLSERTIATLDDGTPLVTRKSIGQGQVVLFHVTANAEWSNLPLSVLFVQMLERLSVSTRSSAPSATELAGTVWIPSSEMDAFGALSPVDDRLGIAGEVLAAGQVGPDLPPGIYQSQKEAIAINVVANDRQIEAANWPAGVSLGGLITQQPTPLKGYALLGAMLLLAFDAFASLWLSGRLLGARGYAHVFVFAMVFVMLPRDALAQSTDEFALAATSQTVLAYVLTGDPELDRISEAGLTGLTDALFARTSVEGANPIGVDPETDELSFFPLLYWPVSADQPIPSDAAYARLNRYLRGGGLILFDTRDAGSAGFGARSQNASKLQTLALPLDIPPLEPIPGDHILTRTFYLLQSFPGRHAGLDVWAEAARPDAEQAEGMPFRNLNDNVTPVVIGGNDWASAWAVLPDGRWMFPIGRGVSGEKQREMAIRFGVNLVMHVLTGNYKSDQVHVPALLERLGQ